MKRELDALLHLIGMIMLAVVLLLIVVFSLAPSSAVSAIAPLLSDKIQHYLAYAALGFSAFAAFFSLPAAGSSLIRVNIRMMASTLVFGFAFGAFIEFIQPFFYRSAELMDLLCDVLGIISGQALAFILCLAALHYIKR